MTFGAKAMVSQPPLRFPYPSAGVLWSGQG
jgi:hypothetical protein